MNDQGGSWSEQMQSDSDEEEETSESPYKKLKTYHSTKVTNGHQAEPVSRRVSASSLASSSREVSGEKSIYSKFSESDKDKARRLLFKSIESNCFKVVRDLLQLGVNVDIKNEDKATPLWVAIEENRSLEIISLLMTPTLIGARYKQNLAPIHRAAMNGDHQLMHQMINVLRSKDTPLLEILQTTEEQRIQQVKSERDKPSHASYEIVNKKNKYGWTALHYAADGGYASVLQVLLMEKECDVAMTTKVGQTPFHLAARKGHLLCLKLLFTAAQCSKSLDSLPVADKKGWNVACHASAQDDCTVMQWLLDNMTNYGADINSQTKTGYIAILIACEYQKTEMFKFLLDKSSEFTMTEDGRSALHIAACHDSVEIVDLLLSEGFPVDQQDQHGETALHVAYKWGSTRVQRLLKDYDADTTIENKEGEKPVDVALSKFQIPKEIAKRGKAEIEKFVAELRKGKTKMPRCKLMILGEAGVGKTSLLSLLTGEEFNPRHNETEGVDTDFVCTSKICSVTWKKKAMEGDEEYREVATKQMAQILPDKDQPMKHQKKSVKIPDSHDSLKQQLESLVSKYSKQHTAPQQAATKPLKSRQVLTRSHQHPSGQRIPSSDFQTMKFPIPIPETNSPSEIQPLSHTHLPQAPRLLKATAATHTATRTPRPPSVTTTSVPPPLPRQEPRRQDTPQPSHTTDPDHVHKDIMRRAVKLKKSKSTDIEIKLPLKFSSFDFAGQKHYKPMHHCFLTSRAVYVVAFNVRHLLNEQRDKCIHDLKFWINSIHIYTDNDAKIVLVGTHRGPYPGIPGNDRLNTLTSDQQETIHKIMVGNFDKGCYATQLSWFGNDETDDSIIAMVENSQTGESSGAIVVRQKLLKLGNQYPGNKDDMPTSYLRLEHKIFEERRQRNLISRKEVEGWARIYGIDDSALALTFFHDIGTIIDPSKLPTIFVTTAKLTVLEDTLLLSPQWLADVMRGLMQIKRSNSEYDKQSVFRLKWEGIVDATFLSMLWEKQLEVKAETFQHIAIFLQAYGLIVPVGEQEPQQYYIPSQLPARSEKMKKPTGDCNQVHINFSRNDGFLPPFVLHHLMFKMYSDSNQSEECCFLATEGFIDLLHDCQWWVRQNNDDIIEVWIRTRPNIRTILPAMQYLNQSLVTILKELRAVKYTLGPIAKCVSCGEEKLLEYIGYNGGQQSDVANHLKCPNCAYREQICVNTAAVISKAYHITFLSFREEIKSLGEDVQKYFVKRIKRKNKIDDDDLTSDDILQEWFENKKDPWAQVILALGSYGNKSVVNKIKRDKLFMCQHTD